jgi:hypothetical protein
MAGDLFKYYNERVDVDGESLHWPGGPAGYPFRGPKPPQLKEEEYQNLRPIYKARCGLFHLSDSEEARQYLSIREKCANKYFIQIDRERIWDAEKNNYNIFLEWLEPAYETLAAQTTGRNLENSSGVANDAIARHIADSNKSTTFSYAKLAGLQEAGEAW